MDSSPKIGTITNNKGGVGKTALVVNVGAALAKLGKTVCLIDLDTQGNLTRNLIPNYDAEKQPGIITGLLDPERSVKPSEIMYESTVENLYVIPNEVIIGGTPVSLSNELEKEMDRAEVLKKFIQSDEALKNVDYVLIDTPPTKDLIVANALIASDFFLVPTMCSDGSLNGLEYCVEYANRFKKYNTNLDFMGVILVAADNRRNKTKWAKDQLKEGFGGKFFKSAIPTNANFDDFVNKQLTIFDVPKTQAKGAKEYLDIAKEIVLRSRKEVKKPINSTSEARL